MTADIARVVPFPRSGGEQASRTLRELRLERGWSLNGAAKALMAAATGDEKKALPDLAGLKRNWSRWESGTVVPDGNRSEPLFRPIIARMFGIDPDGLFPPSRTGTMPLGVASMRSALQARRDQVEQEISKLQSELAYLDAVLSVPAPGGIRHGG